MAEFKGNWGEKGFDVAVEVDLEDLKIPDEYPVRISSVERIYNDYEESLHIQVEDIPELIKKLEAVYKEHGNG